MEFCTLNEKEFRKFLNNSPERTFLQTPEIGKLREKMGWSVEYLGVKHNKKIVAATMMASIKRYFGFREFYAPRGFLLDYNDKNLLNYFTEEIKKYVKENRGYVFRIDPYVMNVERDINGNIVEGGIDNSNIHSTLLELGYRKVKKKDLKQVDWMYVLDVFGKNEGELLNNMKANTRNTIRKTMKSGIEIVELKKDELSIFYKIMEETGKRKSFSVREKKYFELMYDMFYDRGEIKYLVARLNLTKYIESLNKEKEDYVDSLSKISESKKNAGKKKAINEAIDGLSRRIEIAEAIYKKDGNIINLSASMFLLTQPEVVYLSSGNYEKYLFFNAQYLIQWHMIKYALNNGFKRYNFYGISGNFDKNSEEYGVYEFKTGFGGKVVELIGEYEYPTSFIYKFMRLLHK